MRITYDTEGDALYIRLIEEPAQVRSIRLSEDVALNMGEGERLVGIEILDASHVLGLSSLPTLILQNISAAKQ